MSDPPGIGLRLSGSPENARIELSFQSHPRHLAPVRKAVEDFAQQHGFDEKACADIGLCVNEALANVMRHAYKGAQDRPIAAVVSCERGGELQVDIRDWGAGVHPESKPPPVDPARPGGLGLMCLRKLMHGVRYEPQPDGMRLLMTRRKQP